jgi:glycerol uptake facilitator-like aquaporin
MVSYGPATSSASSYTQCAYISLVMFWTFVISGQLSGGQGNPIFTLALILTNGSNVTLLNSIVYILAQFSGAITGGALGFATISVITPPYSNTGNLPLTFGGQLLGTFMFIVLYLMIMCTSTRFVPNFWAYLTVPIAYYITAM